MSKEDIIEEVVVVVVVAGDKTIKRYQLKR